MEHKRHLTVLATPLPEDAIVQRSAGRWILLGAMLVVALSLPLGMLGIWGSRALFVLVQKVEPWVVAAPTQLGVARHLAAFLPLIASFALAAYLSGIVVVRSGSLRRAGTVAWVGALGGALLASLAAVQGALRPWPVGAVAYATLMAVGGFSAVGARRFGRNSSNTANLSLVSQPGVASGDDTTRRHESH